MAPAITTYKKNVMASPQSREVQEALLAQKISQRLDDLEKEVKTLTNDRDKALRWGIVTLFGAVTGMGVWIVKLIFSNLPIKS